MSNKILIAFDINSFFKTKNENNEASWIINFYFWRAIFSYFISEAIKHNVEVIFEIISIQGQDTHLIDEFENKFEIFKNTQSFKFKKVTIEQSVLSNYHYDVVKPYSVIKMANQLEIAKECCLLIDSSAQCLENALNLGIETVSLINFNTQDNNSSSDKSVQIIENELMSKFANIATKAITVNTFEAMLNRIYEIQHEIALQQVLSKDEPKDLSLSNGRLPYFKSRRFLTTSSLESAFENNFSERKTKSACF